MYESVKINEISSLKIDMIMKYMCILYKKIKEKAK